MSRICRTCNKILDGNYNIFISENEDILYECIDFRCNLSDDDIIKGFIKREYTDKINKCQGRINSYKHTTICNIDEIEDVSSGFCLLSSPCMHMSTIKLKGKEESDVCYIPGAELHVLLKKLGMQNSCTYGYNIDYVQELIEFNDIKRSHGYCIAMDGNKEHYEKSFKEKEKEAIDSLLVAQLAFDNLLKDEVLMTEKIAFYKKNNIPINEYRDTENYLPTHFIKKIESAFKKYGINDAMNKYILGIGSNVGQIVDSEDKLLLKGKLTNIVFSDRLTVYEKRIDGWTTHEVHSNYRHPSDSKDPEYGYKLEYFDGYRQNIITYWAGIVGIEYPMEKA